ncbi:uncharacterized protein [Atheta coriaria]|uniref:uncharacterized protein n=1 Tax=Dalotia coriaria TaxID=877792 RepID=UPI0031F445B6
MSLVCLTKNDKGDTVLAGFNVLSISTPDEKISDIKVDGWFINFILKFFTYLDAQRNVFQEFGVDKCLKAMGLYVLPDYRGEGLGWKLLQARIPLCKSMGIKVTTTVFTSIVSQKQAYKAGFQDYFSVDYDVLGKTKPEFNIPNIQEHTKAVKILYKLVD